jgi:hypothetical protein
MAGEARANKAWCEREHGWYVVNPHTDLAVAKCRTQVEANSELRRRDAVGIPVLIVVGVGLADAAAPGTEGGGDDGE